MEHPTTTPALDLTYARRGEGVYYGEGCAMLAEAVALAVAAAKPTPQARAKAAARACRAFARRVGHTPALEVFARPADQGAWVASYEAGPYQWGLVASEACGQLGIFAEPHWSFDLHFYPD